MDNPKKYQTKVTKVSSKCYQQYKSKHGSIKSRKNISRSIKTTPKRDYHDTQMT